MRVLKKSTVILNIYKTLRLGFCFGKTESYCVLRTCIFDCVIRDQMHSNYTFNTISVIKTIQFHSYLARTEVLFVLFLQFRASLLHITQWLYSCL